MAVCGYGRYKAPQPSFLGVVLLCAAVTAIMCIFNRLLKVRYSTHTHKTSLQHTTIKILSHFHCRLVPGLPS